MKILPIQKILVLLIVFAILISGHLMAKFTILVSGNYIKNASIILPIILVAGSIVLSIGLRFARYVSLLWLKQITATGKNIGFAILCVFATSLGGTWLAMSVLPIAGWIIYEFFKAIE